MKILYLSCHSILEYDELVLLNELGHEVFSPGAYVEPANPGDASLRPGVPGLVYDPYIVEQYHKLSGKRPGLDFKDSLSKEFVSNFDCIIAMHIPRWIENNWNAFAGKRVIWRTIGQSVHSTEMQIKPYRERGLQIVRYSPVETRIPGYQGCDALIRFYKDPDDLKDWNGNNKRVISFAQSMKQRDVACNFSFFEEVTRPYERHLFGPGNEDIGSWTTGRVPYERLKQEMRDNRVYFYTGTHPASYTLNFMEAWMTGIPIVAVGPKHGNADYFPGHNLYEIPELIENGVNGFVSDNVQELRSYITSLMTFDSVASSISKVGRASAIHHFGKEMIKESWRAFLNA
jgi:hypothetical protein